MLYCKRKLNKQGSGCKVLKLLVAISLMAKVSLIVIYTKRWMGHFLLLFLKSRFHILFVKANKGHTNLFVQGSCPVQNSSIVGETLQQKKTKQLKIPAGSPDPNPIENLFHSVKNKLRLVALHNNVTCDTFDEITARMKRTMYNFSVSKIDKTTKSMSHLD